jgi:acylphosphatase
VTTRARIRVEGIVQGIGFRPYVDLAATRLGLAGFVRNDERGALIEWKARPTRSMRSCASCRSAHRRSRTSTRSHARSAHRAVNAAFASRRARFGGTRVLDVLIGDPLPRIC